MYLLSTCYDRHILVYSPSDNANLPPAQSDGIDQQPGQLGVWKSGLLMIHLI